MDPNANLKEQRELVAIIHRLSDATSELEGGALTQATVALSQHAERLAELVEALDEWITGGGFLPQGWRPRS